MFLTIALVLIVLWALGFFVFPVAGGLVHILLIIAIIAIIWHFLKGRGTTPRV
ncbi:MAG TPA: lmo0937 family membrane protein [Gemmatimonadaceae bacterium]